MADKIFLDNDAVGYGFSTTLLFFPAASNAGNETSAHGYSASGVVPLAILSQAGRVTDCQIGVVTPAQSASGFVSGTVDCDVFLNGASIMSTKPAIQMTSASTGRQNTFTSGANLVSGVVNAASAVNAIGDQLGVRWNARSVGSAAAGNAGTGLYGYVAVRPASV